MKHENTVKLLLDLEYVKKLQNELPSKTRVIMTSLFQFFVGIWILASLIDNTEDFSFKFIIPLTAISIGVILFSAYTYFGFLIRKRYILLIESLIQRNDYNNENSA